jgi:hypothetical protein
MIFSHTTQVAERAKAIYSRGLQAELEAAHPNSYVAIVPESGEHFVADSFGGAVAAARSSSGPHFLCNPHWSPSRDPSGRIDQLNGRVDKSLHALVDVADDANPEWLSTAGAGVSWLHVRLDDRPKYYGYAPYR